MEENALEIRELQKSFGEYRLGPLNLTLPNGCIMGLIGENGAGKSTTMRLILGMIKKDAGSIRVLGQDVDAPGFSRVREDIGVVLDEVGMPQGLNAVQIGRVLRDIYRQWDAAAYANYLDMLTIPKKQAFCKLSRGTKMKLGIAAALSHRPKLLLLDEATGGLDPVVRDEVVEVFSDFTRDPNHAVLIASHIVSDLEKLSDYIAFLHEGKLLLTEEKDALTSQYGILHCALSDAQSIDPTAILGKHVTPYGAELMVKRDCVPAGMQLSPVTIEELFLCMVKGGRSA